VPSFIGKKCLQVPKTRIKYWNWTVSDACCSDCSQRWDTRNAALHSIRVWGVYEWARGSVSYLSTHERLIVRALFSVLLFAYVLTKFSDLYSVTVSCHLFVCVIYLASDLLIIPYHSTRTSDLICLLHEFLLNAKRSMNLCLISYHVLLLFSTYFDSYLTQRSHIVWNT